MTLIMIFINIALFQLLQLAWARQKESFRLDNGSCVLWGSSSLLAFSSLSPWIQRLFSILLMAVLRPHPSPDVRGCRAAEHLIMAKWSILGERMEPADSSGKWGREAERSCREHMFTALLESSWSSYSPLWASRIFQRVTGEICINGVWLRHETREPSYRKWSHHRKETRSERSQLRDNGGGENMLWFPVLERAGRLSKTNSKVDSSSYILASSASATILHCLNSYLNLQL